jgi:hypothetical protein
LRSTKGKPTLETLDDMRRRHLLTREQHAEIGAWVARVKTPEAILEMPPHLWRALSLASVLMNVDADLMQPPPLGQDGGH